MPSYYWQLWLRWWLIKGVKLKFYLFYYFLTDTFMSELMAECVGTYDRLPSIALASLTQTASSSCCVPVLVAWELTSLLLTPVWYLTLTGTLKMTCRYKTVLNCLLLLELNLLASTGIVHSASLNPLLFQAQARCHRIGQSKAVKVYRLITRNSYEREMLDKASLKLGLDRAVLQSMSGNKDSNVNGVRKLPVCKLTLHMHL